MKILSILGSPKKNSYTGVLEDSFLKGIKDGEPNAKIDNIFLPDYMIRPCLGCNFCKSGEGICVYKDDMSDILSKFKNADIIIYSSPVYWWNVTAQLKTFIDRTYSLDIMSDFQGKKMIFLSTHGSNEEESGVKIAEASFREIAGYTGMEFLYRYSIETFEKSIDDLKVEYEKAYELGKNLFK